MSSILDVAKAISTISLLHHDGAIDKKGKKVESGLRRECEVEISDRRVIDGFSAKVAGNKMILNYHSECTIHEMHNKDFETDLEKTMNDVLAFLKKEYKALTKETLSLKEEGKMDYQIESTSRVRSWVKAQRIFTITSVKSEDVPEKKLENAMKSWIALGKNDTPGW
jgi:hypothetical protein